MKRVRMRHPGLEAEIEVFASAVPHHGSAGWELVPEDETVPTPDPKKITKPSRTRTTKESD